MLRLSPFLLCISIFLGTLFSTNAFVLFPGTTTRERIYPSRSSPSFHNKEYKLKHSQQTNVHVLRTSQLSSTVMSSSTTWGVGSHFLIRILFLRGLAFIYIVAFTIAYRQNKALIGDNGITPARDYLNAAEKRGITIYREQQEKKNEKDRFETKENMLPLEIVTNNSIFFIRLYSLFNKWINSSIKPKLNNIRDSAYSQTLREKVWNRSDPLRRPLISLFWFLSKKDRLQNMNKWLDTVAFTGLTLSSLMFISGSANVPLLIGLWLCQRSLMSVGGPWYQYGWETQLAELTFHSFFLVPLLSMDPLPLLTPVPNVPIWAMRWFLFRIMMGAGMIKLKSGDDKWTLKKLSTMNYFYETQPVPNPFSHFFHFRPNWWHKIEVLLNHFVELVSPWLLIIPGISRNMRITGGAIQIIFQSVLITGGNLSFLNWLTMLPALFCFDDSFVSFMFSKAMKRKRYLGILTNTAMIDMGLQSMIRSIVNFSFGSLILILSIPVVKNLLSKRQRMNASFDPLRLVNSYGAFGSVDEERIELVVETADNYSGPWTEYQFKVKPGDVTRRPPWISPYHHRLDWQMWIAFHGTIENSPWMLRFLLLLLQEDEEVLGLLKRKSASSSLNISNKNKIEADKPKYIRVEKYIYHFNQNTASGEYWKRHYVGKFFPKQGVCTEATLTDILNRSN